MVLMTCLQLLMVLQWKYTWQGCDQERYDQGREAIEKVTTGVM